MKRDDRGGNYLTYSRLGMCCRKKMTLSAVGITSSSATEIRCLVRAAVVLRMYSREQTSIMASAALSNV